VTLRLDGVSRRYEAAGSPVRVLEGVSLRVRRGELVAIFGPSGSGKSTLLRIAAGYEQPDAGSVSFDGVPLRAIDEDRWRRELLGVVWQTPLLLPGLPAIQQVALRLAAGGVRPSVARERAERQLSALGLAERLHQRPETLSGGERQRVALAVALVTDPAVVLADEPTGSLDRARSLEVFDLLARTAHEQRRAVLLVTHDAAAAAVADRCLRLADGELRPMDDRLRPAVTVP
jgi:ABC-type lipoprotein export system ATPase subunit